MPDQVDAELQRLRARAYGPGADIDEASVERLRELEAQHLTARAARARDAAVPTAGALVTPPVDEQPPADPFAALFGPIDAAPVESVPSTAPSSLAAPTPAPAPAPAPPRPAPPVLRERVRSRSEPPHPDDASDEAAGSQVAVGEAPLAAPASLGPDPLPRTLDRRLRTGWIASLAVAVALTALVTAWALPSQGGGAAGRLTLQAYPTVGESTSGGMSLEEGARYFGDYHGLHIYQQSTCLQAAVGDARRPMWGGCTGVGLEPMMEIYVDAEGQGMGIRLPEELVDHMPDGGVVRFTLRGDTVLIDEGGYPVPPA